MDIPEIKRIMKERGITQIELSKKSNIPLQTIRKIFAGITGSPRVDTMQAIEKALGLLPEAPNNNDIVLQNDEERLLSAYRALIPAMREYALQMLEMLASQPQNSTKKSIS